VNFIEALHHIDTATLANAVERLEVRDRTDGYADLRLRRLVTQPRPMVGYAVTLRIDSTTPGRVVDNSGFRRFRAAILEATKPCVVVCQEAGPTPEKGCHMGDMVGTMLARNGVVGVVSGSGVRDLSGLGALGLSAFALGTVAAHGVYTITEVNVDVEVAGLRVRPGDLLHGDDSGLLSVPLGHDEQLLALVEQVRDQETERKRTADQGWRGWPSGAASSYDYQ
jgi:4-hydroxy-4-methyl-2-oxoglutarate aldolase